MRTLLIQGLKRPIHPVAHDTMDELIIMKALILTKDGSGASGLNAERWRRILSSRAFGTATLDLRKNICSTNQKVMCIRVGVNIILGDICRLQTNSTGLKPGLISVGVGEALRRIAGKTVILFKNDVTHGAGALQLSTGQDVGVEAVVHAMDHVFYEKNTETVLLP